MDWFESEIEMETDRIDVDKQNKIIIKNGVISVGLKGVSYLISFFSTPLLLNCLGETKYGIYVTALSLVSWIYYFDFGIGSGLRNKVTSAIIKSDYVTAKNSVNVAYYIISLISLGVSAVVFVLSLFFNFDHILNVKLEDENFDVIIVVAVVFASLNFVLSLSKNLLWAIQKPALVDGIGVVSQLFWLMALVIYYHTGRSMMLVIVLFEGLTALIRNIIAYIYIAKNYPYIKPSIGKIDLSYSKDILGFGIQIFIMQISALVLNATDNVIITKLFSAADVTPYNMGHKYFSIINSLFIAATGALWTAYTRAYSLKDVQYIKSTLRKSLLFYAITFLGIVLALFIFKPFMHIYLGRDLQYQPGLISLIALYYAILILSHNFSAFVHGISKVKITTIACVISAIVNVPCSIFFASMCGLKINGIILGSVVSLLITTPCYVYTTINEIRKLEKTQA